MKRFKQFAKNQDGFSLVEVAIVLVILGLLIGGVLKGQELLESARLKSVLTQVSQFQLANANFQDRYNALPGDYDQASQTIDARLKNGNNNGIIDGPGMGDGASSEAVSYWDHLSASEMLPSFGRPENGLDFNKGLPASRLGGGYTIEYQPLTNASGHWFILGQKSGHRNTGALLTPQQAFSLMNKTDSPDPQAGRIRAQDGQSSPRYGCVRADGRFNLKEKNPTCVVYFQM